jgi:hypothetical protein
MIRSLQTTKFAVFDLKPMISTTDEESGNGGCNSAVMWMTEVSQHMNFGSAVLGVQSKSRRRRAARALLKLLTKLDAMGYTLVTWGGLRRLWHPLAEASGDREVCRYLASTHVDMLFHLVCARGHSLGLARAARGLGFDHVLKADDDQLDNGLGLSGVLVMDLYATLWLAEKCEARGSLSWRTGSGQTATLLLPDGWLTVEEAMKLPKPDVVGLDCRVSRRMHTAWMY